MKYPDEILYFLENLSESSVIISDYDFGEEKINGINLLKIIKSKNKKLKSCLMSGFEKDHLLKGVNEGTVDYYVAKDYFEIESFIDRIRLKV